MRVRIVVLQIRLLLRLRRRLLLLGYRIRAEIRVNDRLIRRGESVHTELCAQCHPFAQTVFRIFQHARHPFPRLFRPQKRQKRDRQPLFHLGLCDRAGIRVPIDAIFPCKGKRFPIRVIRLGQHPLQNVVHHPVVFPLVHPVIAARLIIVIGEALHEDVRHQCHRVVGAKERVEIKLLELRLFHDLRQTRIDHGRERHIVDHAVIGDPFPEKGVDARIAFPIMPPHPAEQPHPCLRRNLLGQVEDLISI